MIILFLCLTIAAVLLISEGFGRVMFAIPNCRFILNWRIPLIYHNFDWCFLWFFTHKFWYPSLFFIENRIVFSRRKSVDCEAMSLGLNPCKTYSPLLSRKFRNTVTWFRKIGSHWTRWYLFLSLMFSEPLAMSIFLELLIPTDNGINNVLSSLFDLLKI